MPAAKVADVASSAAADHKLVRTVALSIEVGDPAQARSRAESAAAAKGGFVERLEAQEKGQSQGCHLVLRVPAEHLDAVLTAIRALAGHVGGETQSVEDVTTKWIDLDARLTSLRATEQELLALLKESRERESGVEEIMAVHRELTGIRTQIEATNWESVRRDVHRFIRTAELPTLSVWSREFFLAECEKVPSTP